MLKKIQNLPTKGWEDLVLRASVACLVSWLAVCTIANSPLYDLVVVPTSMKVRFGVRELVGHQPKLHPKLKIFSIDDATVDRLDATDLDLTDWSTLFAAIDARKPSSILVEKVFDLMPGHPKSLFVDRLNELNTPITTQTFVTNQPLNWRRSVSLRTPYYGLLDMMNQSDETGRRSLSDVNWIPVETGFVYGPDREIQAAFSQSGFIDQNPGAYFNPFFRLSKMRAVPHWGITAAESIKFRSGALELNGHQIPMSHDGKIAVNFPSLSEFGQKLRSFKDIYLKSQVRATLDEIEEGDTVVILTSMYSGAVKSFSTPVGFLPSSYVQVSIMNSVLTGEWLKPVKMHALFYLISAILGTLVGVFLFGRWFLTVHNILTACLAFSAISLFVYSDFLAPWVLTSLGFWLSGIFVYADLSRLSKLDQIRIEKEVETARFVQNSIFPKRVNRSNSLSVVGEYLPASECSGDWWGHFVLPDGREYLLVGDALGHGVPAAMVTSMAYSCVSTLIENNEHQRLSPAIILDRLNKVLTSATDGEYSMTLVCLEFDFNEGIISYANAGHQFPVLIPRNPNDFRIKRKLRTYQKISQYTPIWLQSTSPILGLELESTYKDTKIDLQPGDKVMCFTDGIVEGRNLIGEAWGVRNLVKRFLGVADLELTDSSTELIRAADLHSDGQERDDDLTLVLAAVSDRWEPKFLDGNLKKSS